MNELVGTESLPVLPFERPGVLEPPPLLLRLQAEAPIRRVTTPAGDVAWLVTGYENVKTLLDDRRLGRSHPDPERAPRYTQSLFGGGPNADYATEQADHTRVRRILTRSFMVKRMNAMRPAIQRLVDGLLDQMAAGPRPADLHDALSVPLPVLVICELLGVPYEDRDDFRRWSDDSTSMWDAQRAAAGFSGLFGYMRQLVARKREQRTEDVISDLVTESERDAELTDDTITLLGAGLLFAGHETTMTRLDLGAFRLLTNPEARRELERDPGLLAGIVEEILRLGSVGQGLLARYANADLEVAGVGVRAGELVLLSLATANRDDRVFPDPERFVIGRDQNQHVTFGHGHRFCLGAGLARVELQIGLGTLFRRFPTLELAVPVSELRERDDASLGGLTALPVTW